MLVREVMSAPAITVSVRATVKAALRLLDKNVITALPVVDGDGRIIGVVSEADLLKDRMPHDPRLHAIPTAEESLSSGLDVGDVMTRHPMTVVETSDLAEAAEVMTTTAVKSLPVVDHDGRVVGVVSRRDIVHVLARQDDRIQAEADELFRSADMEWLVSVEEGIVTVTWPADEREASIATVMAGSIPGVLAVHVG